MPVMEQSLAEEKKSKEESTSVKKKRKREPEEDLEMETAGAASREEDLETAKGLGEKYEARRGDNGFDGDFGSVGEKKAYDLNVADDAESDHKKEKKKKKKRKTDAMDLEEMGDGGFVMSEENGRSVCESEDKTKLDKKERKKKKKKADNDAMELVEMGGEGFAMGEENGGSVYGSEDKTKFDKKEKQKKKKKADKDVMELDDMCDRDVVMGEENGGSVCESEGKTKLDKKERKKEKKKAEKHAMELEEMGGGGFVTGEENGGSVCESEDKTKLDKKERRKKKQNTDKDAKELDKMGDGGVVMGEDNGGSVCESEDKTKLDKKERKKKRKKADKGGMELEKHNADMGEGNDGQVCKSKKCSVTLEEAKQVDMSKGEDKKREGKKKTKESGNVSQGVGQDTLAAGDVKSATKERKKSKDKNKAGAMRKEKLAQGKDEGKRVSFTDVVEVFDDGGDDEETGEGSDSELVHGKRFTEEEDAILMEALVKYAEMKQLGEKGLEMIRECKKHPELRGCWPEIAKALPHRPQVAIYKRARILLYRSDIRKWTQEELETIRRFVEENGTNWKKLAVELGKSEIHVKDTWRRIKPKNLRTGHWTQEEIQNLFELVNLDLRVKAHQEFNPGHRLIRENISWEAISDKLTTRRSESCCVRWYNQLASPLVKQGVWADSDDYRLVEALQKVDAACLEDIDWDNLLDHRSGELCRKRWNQMVRLLGEHREKPFIEQVQVLASRYSIDMIDYRK